MRKLLGLALMVVAFALFVPATQAATAHHKFHRHHIKAVQHHHAHHHQKLAFKKH